jgi:Amidase
VDFALGTDTGGSTRVPASNCGIWGFRPSHGFVSVAGVNPLAPSFDTVGVLAHSVDVMAKVGLVLLAHSPVSAIKLQTIHLIQEAFALADANVQQALSKPVRWLRDLFSERVRELSLREFAADEAASSFQTWAETFCVIQWAEIKSCLGGWIAEAKPEFGPNSIGNVSRKHCNDANNIFDVCTSFSGRTICCASQQRRCSLRARAIHRFAPRAAAAIMLGRWHSRALQALAGCHRCRFHFVRLTACQWACHYSRDMDRTCSCSRWRRTLNRHAVVRFIHVRSAQRGACIDTIFRGLNFFVHEK